MCSQRWESIVDLREDVKLNGRPATLIRAAVVETTPRFEVRELVIRRQFKFDHRICMSANTVLNRLTVDGQGSSARILRDADLAPIRRRRFQ